MSRRITKLESPPGRALQRRRPRWVGRRGRRRGRSFEEKLDYHLKFFTLRGSARCHGCQNSWAPQAGLVELFWDRGVHYGVLDFSFEEVDSRKHEDAAENEEDQRRPGQLLSSQVLHHDIEGEVHGNVGEEDEEEDGGEVGVQDEEEEHAEDAVHEHEDDQKPKSERWFKCTQCTSESKTHSVI